jgi:sugar phosphate isomerase/epimerase
MYMSWNPRAVGLSLPAEESVEIAARAGFTGVDIMVRDLIDMGGDPRQLRRLMDHLGLRGGAWPLSVRWRGDRAQFEADLARLPRLSEAANVLGLRQTGTWVMPEVDRELEVEMGARSAFEFTLELHLDRLGRIAGLLADQGIRLGLEIMGPMRARSGNATPFVTRYAELPQKLGPLRDAHPNIGLLVDGFHLFASGEDIHDALFWGERSIVWVHVADPAHQDRSALEDHQRRLPGEMESRSVCSPLLAHLSKAGYDGPVTVEPLSSCASLAGLDPLQTANRTLQALREAWPISTV